MKIRTYLMLLQKSILKIMYLETNVFILRNSRNVNCTTNLSVFEKLIITFVRSLYYTGKVFNFLS